MKFYDREKEIAQLQKIKEMAILRSLQINSGYRKT